MFFGRSKEVSAKMRELERRERLLEEEKKRLEEDKKRHEERRCDFSRKKARDDLIWIKYRKLEHEFLQLLDDGVPLVDVYLDFVNRRWKLDKDTFDRQRTVKQETIEYEALTMVIEEGAKALARKYCWEHGWYEKYSGEWAKEKSDDRSDKKIWWEDGYDPDVDDPLKDQITPSTLTPDDREHCYGNGLHEGYRFMCPECPYGETCAPECQ